MNYNLEHYVYMNLVKLGHEVKFYGYEDELAHTRALRNAREDDRLESSCILRGVETSGSKGLLLRYTRMKGLFG